MISGVKVIKGEPRDKSHYSFVGIQRNSYSGQLEFWLPLGFEDFDERNFADVKNFFFKMYRTFNIYLKRRRSQLVEGEERDTIRDGFYEASGGFRNENKDRDEVILYSKINALDKVIEGYDELKIYSLMSKQKRTDEIEYSQIHRYLHHAIYLENDVVYVDEMNLPKHVIVKDSPALLKMFCFIFTEIKYELDEYDSIPTHAYELAEDFKEEHLQGDVSLFGSEDMLNRTVASMKELLEDIDLTTVYKDEDYWHFYEAVEAFLYAEKADESGIYWGISNFYDVWEDMCVVYFTQSDQYSDRILYAEIQGRLFDYGKQAENPFEITLNREKTKRYLKPDLVLEGGQTDNISAPLFEDVFNCRPMDNRKWIAIDILNEDFADYYYLLWRNLLPHVSSDKIKFPQHSSKIRQGSFQVAKKAVEREMLKKQNELIIPSNAIHIIDYKYLAERTFNEYNPYAIDHEGENKIREDIKKQFIYEWAVQNTMEGSGTISEFWIPFFDRNTIQHQALSRKLIEVHNDAFNQSQIQVYKIAFNQIQEFYLKNWFNDKTQYRSYGS